MADKHRDKPLNPDDEAGRPAPPPDDEADLFGSEPPRGVVSIVDKSPLACCVEASRWGNRATFPDETIGATRM